MVKKERKIDKMENIKETIIEAIENKELIGIKARYSREALFFYPTKMNNEFFLGVEEFDFVLDGYQIRKTEDITDSLIIRNFSSEINVKEGLLDQVIYFDINLNSWYTIFNDLMKMNNIVSIEREYNDEDEFFLIGEIIEVNEEEVIFRDFDVDGKWNEELNIVPFDIITTIRFNSRYINVWNKYIKTE